MTQPAPDAEAKTRQKDQEDEYGTWVATEDINFGNALAYREGDSVPVSNVKAYGYDKQGVVKKVSK